MENISTKQLHPFPIGAVYEGENSPIIMNAHYSLTREFRAEKDRESIGI